MTSQAEITLKPKSRGFHLITNEVLSALKEKDFNLPQTGILHVFIKHTSCGLALCENYDPSVRHDMAMDFDRLVPENAPYYMHTLEGSDDMPSHTKSVLTGSSLMIPIVRGHLGLGTWQGIYLCEFRDYGGPRKLVITALD